MTFAQKLNNASGMPKMDSAFSGWQMSITIGLVSQTVTDGDVRQSIVPFVFEGTIQPLMPEQLKVKPEGQRSFKWLMIHCLTGQLNLKTNDIIYYDDERFKVMGIWDWKLNNFIEYHIIQDFQG